MVLAVLLREVEGSWFSDSEGLRLRNCPLAPTYSLDLMGHFCNDISFLIKPSSQTGSGRRGLVVPPPLRRGPGGGGSWCPLLSDGV
ncbi:hypothetical protein CgunFtcFv8_015993 [Champsocephalus gunnari]|uniref:Uncharacterized protein n=1 Tax=Champsocephalus gunnari TaxID=52237 RepID=A0AAN8CBK3_CHAGU|nr:hypothetical protein CgunFtcFv8_015993 [Champsocephalus gunnari]